MRAILACASTQHDRVESGSHDATPTSGFERTLVTDPATATETRGLSEQNRRRLPQPGRSHGPRGRANRARRETFDGIEASSVPGARAADQGAPDPAAPGPLSNFTY